MLGSIVYLLCAAWCAGNMFSNLDPWREEEEHDDEKEQAH